MRGEKQAPDGIGRSLHPASRKYTSIHVACRKINFLSIAMPRQFRRKTRRKQDQVERLKTKRKPALLPAPFWANKISFPKVDQSLLTDTKSWSDHLDFAASIWNKSGHGKGVLRKGTRLFHGSPQLNPVKNLQQTGRPFFFGLDAYIAIWYTLESASSSGKTDLQVLLDEEVAQRSLIAKNIEDISLGKWTAAEMEKMKAKYTKKLIDLGKKQDSTIAALNKLGSDYSAKPSSFKQLSENMTDKARRFYFLNIYETTRDLEYVYLDAGITEVNPLDVPRCLDVPCLHPQFGYHGDTLEPPLSYLWSLLYLPKCSRPQSGSSRHC